MRERMTSPPDTGLGSSDRPQARRNNTHVA